jgi:hypothetical protein
MMRLVKTPAPASSRASLGLIFLSTLPGGSTKAPNGMKAPNGIGPMKKTPTFLIS